MSRPAILQPAARPVVDRLVAALMTLLRAVAPGAPDAPALTEAAAQTLFFRLCQLVTRLIRIRSFGLPAPTKPNLTTQEPDHPAPEAPPNPPTRHRAATALPRRPGWILAALPEIAPPVAAEIAALLADPAIATLLDHAPSLRRTLRPLLRGLGLDAAPQTPTPPEPPSSNTEPPNPAPPPSPATRRHRFKIRPANFRSPSSPYSLRHSNDAWPPDAEQTKCPVRNP